MWNQQSDTILEGWQDTLDEAMTRGVTARAYADGFGVWHADVTVPTIGQAAGLMRVAHAALAIEIGTRGTDATIAWLADEDAPTAERFGINEAEPPARRADGIHYHYIEAPRPA